MLAEAESRNFGLGDNVNKKETLGGAKKKFNKREKKTSKNGVMDPI